MKDHPTSLGLTCGQHVETLAIVGFLDQDLRCKSIAVQIPQDAGWNRSALPWIEFGTGHDSATEPQTARTRMYTHTHTQTHIYRLIG